MTESEVPKAMDSDEREFTARFKELELILGFQFEELVVECAAVIRGIQQRAFQNRALLESSGKVSAELWESHFGDKWQNFSWVVDRSLEKAQRREWLQMRRGGFV